MKINWVHENGCVYTRDQAEGAIPKGTRIMKTASQPGESRALGLSFNHGTERLTGLGHDRPGPEIRNVENAFEVTMPVFAAGLPQHTVKTRMSLSIE